MDRGPRYLGCGQPVIRRDLVRTILTVQVNNRDTLSHENHDSTGHVVSDTGFSEMELVFHILDFLVGESAAHHRLSKNRGLSEIHPANACARETNMVNGSRSERSHRRRMQRRPRLGGARRVPTRRTECIVRRRRDPWMLNILQQWSRVNRYSQPRTPAARCAPVLQPFLPSSSNSSETESRGAAELDVGLSG